MVRVRIRFGVRDLFLMVRLRSQGMHYVYPHKDRSAIMCVNVFVGESWVGCRSIVKMSENTKLFKSTVASFTLYLLTMTTM